MFFLITWTQDVPLQLLWMKLLDQRDVPKPLYLSSTSDDWLKLVWLYLAFQNCLACQHEPWNATVWYNSERNIQSIDWWRVGQSCGCNQNNITTLRLQNDEDTWKLLVIGSSGAESATLWIELIQLESLLECHNLDMLWEDHIQFRPLCPSCIWTPTTSWSGRLNYFCRSHLLYSKRSYLLLKVPVCIRCFLFIFRYGLVIFGGIDGYSRKVSGGSLLMWLMCVWYNHGIIV